MNGELLLHWMSDRGEGGWPLFRQAVVELLNEDADLESELRAARARLSDLAHAEFFVRGTNRWRVLRPILAGTTGHPQEAVLCGGRSRSLLEDVQRAAVRSGCRVSVTTVPDTPDDVRVSGPAEALPRVASALSVPYVAELASALCAQAQPISSVVGSAAPESPPRNWSPSSFDFRTMAWVDGLEADSAYRFTSRHGPARYYVRGPRRTLRRVDARIAPYAVAAVRCIPLLSYDATRQTLSMPRRVPMPEPYARIAAACAGRAAAAVDGMLVYEGIPKQIAAALFVLVGQRPLDPVWLPDKRKRR